MSDVTQTTIGGSSNSSYNTTNSNSNNSNDNDNAASYMMTQVSPISTLERQYSHVVVTTTTVPSLSSSSSSSSITTPSGSSGSLIMAVHCNTACCISIQEMFKLQQGRFNDVTATTATATTSLEDNHPSQQQQLHVNGSTMTNQDDPFSFLHTPNNTTNTTNATTTETKTPIIISLDGTNTNTNTMMDTNPQARKNRKKNPLNTFFKSVASTTTKQIERGLHHLAIKADQGRTPDMIRIGVFTSSTTTTGSTSTTNSTTNHTSTTNNTNQQMTTLLSATEPEPIQYIPTNSNTVGIQFRIPLLIPPPPPTTTTNTTNPTTVQLKLFVKSGATMGGLSSKYYLLAESNMISIQQLQDALFVLNNTNNTNNTNHHTNTNHHNKPNALFFTINMNSIYVLGGQISCIVMSEPTRGGKFPIPPSIGAVTQSLPNQQQQQRGWSLQDPNPHTAYNMYNPNHNTMFHLPLDQTYIFPFLRSSSNNNTKNLFGIERTVESTVVLPIATAMAKLVMQASQRSLQHCCTVRNNLYHRSLQLSMPTTATGDATATTTNTGIITHDYADVNVRISHLRTNTIASSYLQDLNNNSSTTTTSTRQQQQQHPPLMVSLLYQRPDSIFEVELLPMTKLPLHPMAAGGLRPDISCHFYPQPIPNNQKDILPTMTTGAMTNSSGFVLGNVRIQITLPFGQQQTRTGGGMNNNNNNNTASNNTTVFDPATMGCGNMNTVIDNPFDPMYRTTPSIDDTWECIVPLDLFVLPQQPTNQVPKEFPIYNSHGQCMGSIVISFTVKMIMSAMTKSPQEQQQHQSASSLAAGGLVSMVGLTNVIDGILPTLDFAASDDSIASGTNTTTPTEQLRRRSQLATMGQFVTYAYLDQHIQSIRQIDCDIMKNRAVQYQQALDTAYSSTTTEMAIPSYQDRTPKPFRPSSSRNTMLLSGIGFNVHTATFSLDVIDSTASTQQQQQQQESSGAVLHNITCGAPADHARGFSNIFATGKDKSNANTMVATPASNHITAPYSNMGFKSPIGPVVGGLRRLEGARKALADEIQNQQTILIMSIANYFVGQRQKFHTPAGSSAMAGTQQRPMTHVPVGNEVLQGLRSKIFEAVQCLHHLTWICAVRRANVFSQTLGIAVSSYLSSVSDRTKQQSNWPELWTRHGFLVSYEGLLSAAGKELGMIEDASVGIDMLRMVRMILVPDTGAAAHGAAVNSPTTRVPVPHSLYLRWIDLTPQPTPNGQNVEYILQIGIDQQYFNQHIPTALKNGTSVRFYPILFEVGVDIFQAASNLGSTVSRHVNTSTVTATCEPDIIKDVVNDDDDDDIAGISDDDVLVQLNYEAFQKMNAYAQSVAPAPFVQATPQYQTHPLLATLFQHILSSSGKMNHEILAEAAALAQRFSGGIVVFCKSGKDRTAMHLTYKQAQFVTRFRQQHYPDSTTATVATVHDAGTDNGSIDTTLNDAMLIRLYGTRLPICEKNVGQAKYAFNSLQVKFMPDALKPPPSALAGFLKGGKVFGGGGGIES